VITAVFLSFAIAAPPKVKTFAQLSPTASKNASDRKRQKSHPRVDLAGRSSGAAAVLELCSKPARDALDGMKVNWILDADIRSLFDEVSREWLLRFVEHRIGDSRIIRLIRKWLRAGILDDGVVSVSERGTGEGAVISPLLANIHLHYVFDRWAARWRRREAKGDMIILRYADDLIVGFEHEADARQFLEAMGQDLRSSRCRCIRRRPA
jgi:hypothetical protein